jgi:hypothetical protein
MFTIFIYVNDKKILDSKESRIQNLEEKLAEVEQENQGLSETNMDLIYFSLENNEEALSYFENQGIDATTLENTIKDAIISRNRADEDNDLIPFAGMNGVMRINKLKVLNHKWILADFTDGKYWGELFITYEIDENKNLSLNTEKSFLYPVN